MTRSPNPPSLKLEYLPGQLLFVSKEESVHQLAYGSYKAEHSKFTVADILSVLPLDERKNLPLETARSGSAQRQGGQAAVTHPPPPAPIKTYILWAVLILSALILGLLAPSTLPQRAVRPSAKFNSAPAPSFLNPKWLPCCNHPTPLDSLTRHVADEVRDER